MMISLKHLNRRAGAVLVSLLLLLTLAVSASAAAVKMSVGVRFWRETGDKESMADSAVDTAREATLTRQPNGTFTLELPVKQISSMNMTGSLTGIRIGEVNYEGTLSGELSNGTAVLTLKNLPASVTSPPARGCPSGSSAEYTAQKAPRSSQQNCGALALFQVVLTRR